MALEDGWIRSSASFQIWLRQAIRRVETQRRVVCFSLRKKITSVQIAFAASEIEGVAWYEEKKGDPLFDSERLWRNSNEISLKSTKKLGKDCNQWVPFERTFFKLSNLKTQLITLESYILHLHSTLIGCFYILKAEKYVEKPSDASFRESQFLTEWMQRHLPEKNVMLTFSGSCWA